jgi:hypothetical protein
MNETSGSPASGPPATLPPRPAAAAAPVPFEDPYLYPAHEVPTWAVSANIPALCFYKRKVGRMYVLLEKEDGTPLMVMGPCWPMWFGTCALITSITIVVLYFFASKYLFLWIPATFLAVVVLVFFVITGCSNPGIVRRHQEMNEHDDLWDDKAQTYRPRGARFDMETGIVGARSPARPPSHAATRAAQDIDHFCPWTGTLIAKGNIVAFHVFSTTLCVLCPFITAILVWGIVTTLPSRQ